MQTTTLDDKSFIDYYPNFFDNTSSNQIYQYLCDTIPWRKVDGTSRFGSYELPRLQCWMSDPNVKPLHLFQKDVALDWSPEILEIKSKLEDSLRANGISVKFDYVLMNMYRSGKDHISYHYDSEAVIEGKDVVASLSFGASRDFIVKHKKKQNKLHQFKLDHGSLVVMRGATQKRWLHSVPPDESVTDCRINLTFRIS